MEARGHVSTESLDTLMAVLVFFAQVFGQFLIFLSFTYVLRQIWYISLSPFPFMRAWGVRIIALEGMHPVVGFKFLSAGSITKVIFSAGFVLANGASVNSNVIKSRETVL